MLEFLRTGRALSVLAAIGAIGFISKLITRSLYKRLLKETDNMAMAKNKNLRILKQKLENVYRLNQNIVNTQVYLEKQIYGFRYLHISLNAWNNAGMQMTILALLAGGAGSFMSYWYRLDSYYIILYASVGALGSLFLTFLDSSFNISMQQKRLSNALLDYADNSVFIRAARENSSRINSGRDRQTDVAAARKEKENSLQEQEKESMLSETGIRNGLVRASEAKKPGMKTSGNRNRKAGELLRAVQNVKPETKEQLQKELLKEAEQRTGFAAVQSGEEACRDIDYIKRSLEQIAASKEAVRKEEEWTKNIDSEEMKILGEIMRQYFAGNE